MPPASGAASGVSIFFAAGFGSEIFMVCSAGSTLAETAAGGAEMVGSAATEGAEGGFTARVGGLIPAPEGA